MTNSADDRHLVDAARRGDRTALDTLLRRHHDRVRAVCRRITGNDADAADATQEALLAVVRGLDRFDGRSSFSTWVYRVATNASLDELRRRRRRPVPASDHDDHEAGPVDRAADPSAHRHTDDLADRLVLDAALARLPEEFRVAVVLRDVADLDYAEIATVLGLPLGTVKSRIARGRSMLADAVTQTDGNHRAPTDRPTPEI